MSTVRTIARNMFFLAASNFTCHLIHFFYIMLIARYFTAQGYGVLAFAAAFTALFGPLADLGLGMLTVREVARDNTLAGKYFANITVIRFLLTIIIMTAIITSINLLDYPSDTKKVVYLVAFSMIPNIFSRIIYSIFQAQGKMEYEAFGSILSSILALSAAIIAITQQYNLVKFATLGFLISIVSLIYALIVWRINAPLPKLEIDGKFWKSAIKESLPFGLTSVFVMLYYWIDSVMLSIIKGNEVVGWYNAAYKLILSIHILPSIFSITIFPLMAKFAFSSKESFTLSYQKFFQYMLILSLPIALGTTLLADKIIMLVFGAGYAPSAIALKILVWSFVFVSLNGVFGRIIESLNKQILGTKIGGIAAILNIILNIIVIPKYSYVGASLTTVVTEFAVLIMAFIVSTKLGYSIPLIKIIKMLSKSIISCLALGLFIWHYKGINIFILTPLSGLLYFVCLYLLRGFDEIDAKIIRSITRKQ